MPNSREVSSSAGFICRTLDRIVACLEGLNPEELNWRPPAAGANSLSAIAIHALANAEENVLSTLCGEPAEGVRDEFAHQQKWAARAQTADLVLERWTDLQARIQTALDPLPASELDREREHPRRGLLTGREILFVAARHAAEHQGQAELTRDLVMALRT